MSQTLTQIVVLSLTFIAIAFALVGILRFQATRLTEKNSIGAVATLVGFRKYYSTDQWGDDTEDYPDNKPGRVPIVELKLDGEDVSIAAMVTNGKLTASDIGSQVKIRYRRFIGITLVIDDEQSIRNYNQLQNVLFWVFIAVAAILAILAVVANSVLPRILSGVIS